MKNTPSYNGLAKNRLFAIAPGAPRTDFPNDAVSDMECLAIK
jgi:hypothetical protein